jgi:hypothetical protein
MRIHRVDNVFAPSGGATAKSAQWIGTEMLPRPHDGTAKEGLSSSLLQVVHEPEQLDRLRSVLSDFCHRCRNTLNGIKLSLYLCRREARGAVPDCWAELEAIYQQIEVLFDHLQSIYRPMPLTMVWSPLDDLIGHHVPIWRSWYESRGRSLELDAPEAEVQAEFDPAQLGAGLDALASWRAQSDDGGRVTRIGWGARDGWVEVGWEEVGPPDRREPLERAEAREVMRRNSSSGRLDPLALPLLARIVAAHGGGLNFRRGPGFRMTLGWPQSPPTNRGDVA